MERRKFLMAVGAVSTIPLAGCAGEAEGTGGSTEEDSSNESSGGDGDSGSDDNQDGGDSNNESDDGGEDDSSDDDSSDATFTVRVQYDGEWSGAVGADGSTRSVDGSGEATFDVEGDPMTISANAQKQDDSDGELIIQILENGDVVTEQSTTAEYGVASTSHSSF